MAEDEAEKRQDRYQRAIATGITAAVGARIGGPIGLIGGATAGPLAEPMIAGVWAELADAVKRRHKRTIDATVEAGVPPEELEDRIHASERTELLTGYALSAAGRTAWDDKVRALGRSLASGLLAEDDAEIDVEQMIIAAITDIEAPQLALLELLVRWTPYFKPGTRSITGPLDVPAYSLSEGYDDRWRVNDRAWTLDQITDVRPKLASVAPSLLGTLQRHGLVVQNDNAREAIEQYAEAFAKDNARYEQEGGHNAFHPHGLPQVYDAGGLVPELTWSPTELGEKVLIRFQDAGTDLADAWTAGAPTDQA